jgi:hypothetical protein
VITNGHHAAIDLRAVMPAVDNEQEKKLNLLIRDASKIWLETSENTYHRPNGKPCELPGTAQMIFCELGTINVEKVKGQPIAGSATSSPRSVFHLRKSPFMQDFKRTAAKQRLFDEVRTGRVRFGHQSPISSRLKQAVKATPTSGGLRRFLPGGMQGEMPFCFNPLRNQSASSPQSVSNSLTFGRHPVNRWSGLGSGKQQGRPQAVCDGVQLKILAAFDASDTGGRATFVADWLRCDGFQTGGIDHQPVGLAFCSPQAPRKSRIESSRRRRAYSSG